MKLNNILTTLGTLMVSALIAHAQDAVTPAAPPAEAPVTNALAADATAPEVKTVVVTEAPAAAPTQANAVIPLIVIDDTPLLDAIRNLARQAGINLMIDPKVAYGQPDPAKPGAVVAQPNVSIRWENITAEQALNALLNNYGLQAVEDPKVKITRVTVKDPAAPDPLITKTIQLKFAGPSNVLAAVTASLTDKRSKVVADIRSSQLVIVATEKEIAEVEQLVAKLDGQTKQVLIEAKLLETTINPRTSKGIDWSGTLQAQKMNFGNNLQADPTIKNLSDNHILATSAPKMLFDTAKGFNPSTAFLDADGLSATLSFLNQNSDSKIIASPRTVTLDNEIAHIEGGTLYPIVNVTAGTAQTAGGSQVNYSNLTVRLDVTPRISANNFIHLKVTPSVMRLVDVQRVGVGEGAFDVPIFATRNLDTTVLIPSGNTLVMGGLVQDTENTGNTKVPILGDIPVLGMLFRKDTKDRNKQNLIIFITPTIVEDWDFQPTKSEYLKTPLPPNDTDTEDWSAWDSGKPRDWSKGGGFKGVTK